MLDELCGEGTIEKNRYRMVHVDHTWEIDVFSGGNAGLVVAEVELSDAAEEPAIPDWIASEVSGQVEYYKEFLPCSLIPV